MAAAVEAIGVISGVLGIFSFLQDMFPSPEAATNDFQFRVGLDGTTGDDGGSLSDAGGNAPDVRCWNEAGTYIGITTNDNNACNSGSETCSTSVESDNACAYTVFSANNDAICIGWISTTFPGGDNYGSPIGNWAQICDANGYDTSGTWYWSNVLVQLDGSTSNVYCAWIDADGDQPTTGLQIHWPEFNGDGSATQQNLDYYCGNNFPLRFITDPDPTGVILPAKRSSARDTMSAASEIEMQKRASNDQYARLHKRFANDTMVIKSKNPVHTASALCAGKKSVGPSFVAYGERQFCEMSAKQSYPFCEDVETGSCWDDAENALITKGGVKARDVVAQYTTKAIWEDATQ